MSFIDWEKEWQAHAFNFQDGMAVVEFAMLGIKEKPYWRASRMLLLPGAGFGDLSHPTTRLVLTLMAEHVHNKRVLDIGCGSGCLSIAALCFGARFATGLDIESEAILHSQQNARHNNFESLSHFGPTVTSQADIILMNMIRLEQKQSFAAVSPHISHVKEAFTSGILATERDLYLEQTRSWGWRCLSITELHGWLGFHFTCS